MTSTSRLAAEKPGVASSLAREVRKVLTQTADPLRSSEEIRPRASAAPLHLVLAVPQKTRVIYAYMVEDQGTAEGVSALLPGTRKAPSVGIVS